LSFSTRGVRSLLTVEEHGDGDPAIARAQDRGRPVVALDAEAESLEKLLAAPRERRARPSGRGAPVCPRAGAGTQLVRREEAFVAHARELGLDRGQGVAQRAQRRVPVGLFQRLAADALDLAAVAGEVGGRVVARRAAERGAVAVEDHEEKRRGAARVPRLPGRAERRRGRRGGARGDEHLQRRGAPS
jgi:hypothetical protein